jgi:hypothetical protein
MAMSRDQSWESVNTIQGIVQIEQRTILSDFPFVHTVQINLLCALATGSLATALDFPFLAVIAVRKQYKRLIQEIISTCCLLTRR